MIAELMADVAGDVDHFMARLRQRLSAMQRAGVDEDVLIGAARITRSACLFAFETLRREIETGDVARHLPSVDRDTTPRDGSRHHGDDWVPAFRARFRAALFDEDRAATDGHDDDV